MSSRKRLYLSYLGDSLSENLKTLRTNKKWSREYLAKRAGVSAMTIVQLEKKDSGARVDTVQRLSKALGVVTSELLGETRSPLTPREAQMVVLYRKLNVKMRRAYMYVGMAMAGEVDEEEEDLRKSADWDKPTVDRDPVKEMMARAEKRGEVRPDLDRLNEIAVELGNEPKPDGTRNPYPGRDRHAELIEPMMNEVLGDS